MKRIVVFIILSSLLLLVGCVSHRQVVERKLSTEAEKLVGMKTDELLLKKGPPDLKENLTTGEKLWTYRSTKAGEHKGWTMSIGNAPSRPNIETWRESINFVISPEGIVRSYSVSVD